MYIANSAKGSQKPMKKEMNIPTPKLKKSSNMGIPTEDYGKPTNRDKGKGSVTSIPK